MHRKLMVIMLAAALLAVAILSTAAAPLAAPCAPGAAYDPACDANQDSIIDVLDIQLTAGHWMQSGSWVSDNNHNHLGQTWTGSGNPLTIGGTYGPPNYAPLVLSNNHSVGNGLAVTAANSSAVDVVSAGRGMYVHTAAFDGIYMDTIGYDGLSICRTGSAVGCTHDDKNNGVEVANAQDNGFHVVHAGGDGLFVCQTGTAASCVPASANNGVEIGNTQTDGIRVTQAGDDGIQIGDGTRYPRFGLYVPSPGTIENTLIPNTTDPAGEWALYTVDNIEAGNVFASGQTLIAVVGGDAALEPGDVVAAAGLAEALPGGHSPLAQVRLATAEQGNVVGVVHSRMALTPLPGKQGEQDLRSVDGPARPGDYVAVTVLGAALVKVDPAVAVTVGQRLTVAETAGHARPLRTVQVEGVKLDESGPSLGVVLEPAGDGLVWALVNPQ